MKLSRKERKKQAEIKREQYTNKIIYGFLLFVEKVQKKENIRPINSFKKCWGMFDEIIEELFIKHHPKDAHLIRSSYINAKIKIKKEFKEYLK